MLRKCAWCNRAMGQVAPFNDSAITHTICLLCSTQMLDEPCQADTSPMSQSFSLDSEMLFCHSGVSGLSLCPG